MLKKKTKKWHSENFYLTLLICLSAHSSSMLENGLMILLEIEDDLLICFMSVCVKEKEIEAQKLCIARNHSIFELLPYEWSGVCSFPATQKKKCRSLHWENLS